MKLRFAIAVCGISFVSCAARADMSSVFDGGWRLSAGAVYDSGVKTDMKFMPQQTYVSPFSLTPGALSRQQAKEQGKGKTVGTRTYYVDKNGNKSWVDSNDPASGHDAGKTRYYAFADGAYDGNGAFTLGEAAFEEMNMEQTAFSDMESFASGDASMPGVSVQLSRNLYHDDENHWGVEMAFAFQYARRNNVFKANSDWMIGSSSKTEGSCSTTYRGSRDSTLSDLLSAGADFLWHSGEYGTCVGQSSETSQDAAVPIDLGDAENHWGETTQQDAAFGSMEARGDYDNMELMLLLQPYYDLCDWFSVNATLGLVVSRQSMEMSFSMLRNGVTEYSNTSDFSQWDVYGVAGLGAMLYFHGFTLSGDFMARFLDREMDISDRYYRGTVERGRWMFRLGLGYEF